jgi:hypothetical protein
MAVTKTELHKVITKLDDVKIELLRLRADLLPEERTTASEKRQIHQGRREIETGRFVTLAQLRKELGACSSVVPVRLLAANRGLAHAMSEDNGSSSRDYRIG